MIGVDDESGRALVTVRLRARRDAAEIKAQAWIDTAFTGELVLPLSMIAQLGLEQSAAIAAGLADGSQVTLETFSCLIEWFGNDHSIEVVANDGRFALLGVGLLLGRKLTVDYPRLTVSIE